MDAVTELTGAKDVPGQPDIASANSSSTPRILLVDDDPAALLRLRQMLEPLGFDIVGSTNDGEHGVELARLLAPDVALIDWDMPRFGGALTARMLDRYAPDVVPVLLLDDRDLVESRATSSDERFSSVAKSSSPSEMQAWLRHIVRRRWFTRRLLASVRDHDGPEALRNGWRKS
jgi:two-component system KDP operon response regulator KdpE